MRLLKQVTPYQTLYSASENQTAILAAIDQSDKRALSKWQKRAGTPVAHTSRRNTHNPQPQETKMLYRMATTSPIFGLRREIDRLFEDTFARDGSSWVPAVDVQENDKEILLELELPGLKPENVEVTAENGVLTVRGEKKSERKEGEENRYHIVERAYGSFMRTFQLPQGIDEEQINAEFENGILTLHIPKAALPQPRKIQINPAPNKKQGVVGNGSSSQNNGSQSVKGKNSATTSQRERDSELAGQSH
jgi:HSP20 family protein